MPRLLDSKVKAMVEQFVTENGRFESVMRWRNTLQSEHYERFCLVNLTKYCIKFSINPSPWDFYTRRNCIKVDN